jgi:outer membrane lipoprotein-sorting protein
MILAAGLGATPVLAADAPAAPLAAADQTLVQKASDYIQALKGVQGRFTQTDARGQVSSGTFSMLRPGRARFEYDPPAQLLVVSDGYNVSIYDRKLKSFDQYPLGQTPLVLLLAKTIKLDRGVTITVVDKTPGGFVLSARDARKTAQGRIDLAFGQNPLALNGWTVIDAQGQKTEVRLGTLTQTATLDPNLFVLRDPKPHSGRP